MIAEPPVSEGADQVKVRLEEVIDPEVKLSGAPGTVAAKTVRVGPIGPSPWTLRALIPN